MLGSNENIKSNRISSKKKTIRLVGWTNEENGAKGAAQYAINHANEAANTVMCFEADSGIFTPFSFDYGTTNSEEGWKWINSAFKNYFAPTNLTLTQIKRGGGGTDIAPIIAQGVPYMSYSHQEYEQYFWYHHTDADTMSKIKPSDLQSASSSIAMLAYLISESDLNFRGKN